MAFTNLFRYLSVSSSRRGAVPWCPASCLLAAKALFLLFVAALCAAACSSLPDVHGLILDARTTADLYTIRENGTPPPETSGEETDIITIAPRVVGAACGAQPSSGNRATVLIDGDVTLAAMLRAMTSARDHINLETYIIRDDEIGRAFADLLLKKRAEGLTVNLLYDSFGCGQTPPEFFDRLRAGGVNTLEYNPMCIGKIGGPRSFYHRSHRKLLIIDGRVAFTGGINIGNAYLSSRSIRHPLTSHALPWRDTDVMIEGPAVADFQELFLASWSDQAGTMPPAAHYFPAPRPRGDQVVQAVGSQPGCENRGTYVMYVSAFSLAQKSIHMTQSYFVPDDQTVQALMDAANRGVDVRIILPGHSDHAIIRQAGRELYGKLLAAGVRIYELEGAILHAKTAVVDGIWSTVGSTNLELWSFVTSDEVNAVIIGGTFADDMEAAFLRDLAQSKEILAEDWRKRPISDRVKEFISNLFRYWL